MNHEERRKTLGASEIAAACGKSPHTTRAELWELKTGRREPFRGNRYTSWGQKLEDLVAQEYFARSEGIDHLTSTPGTQVNGKPWAATPDRLVYLTAESAKPAWILECKTASTDDGWGPSGSQEIPEHYYMQIQWQMFVCGMDRCDVAVLIGGSDYREFTFKRDPEYIDGLVTCADDFWSYVERDEPPPEPVDETQTIPATPEIEKLLTEKLEYAKGIKELEAAEKTARAELMKLVPQGSKCSAPMGSAYWMKRTAKLKTDYEAAFWDVVNATKVDADAYIKARSELGPDVFVFTVKGKK